MKKINILKVFLIFFSLHSSLFTIAQSWQPLQGGLDDQARTLYSDSISGKLLVGGNFYNVNGHSDYGCSAWDGTSWDTTYGLGYYCQSTPNQFIRFQNELYSLGSFTYSLNNLKIIDGFTNWNGTAWDSLNIAFHNLGGCCNGDPIYCCEYNNKLYIVGGGDSVGAYYSPMIVAWDGTNWIPVGIPNYQSGTPWACAVFQNELYIAGNFTAGNLIGCAKFDGTNWTEVGTGGGGLVTSMAVYNNELYIAGGWIGGNNAIVKYDGTNFSTVGGGINAQVWNLKVINNKLFAVGNFDSAGMVYANDIAIWDGTNWSAFSPDTFSGGLSDIAVFQNQIYVTGGFLSVNGVNGFNSIARYDGYMVGGNKVQEKSGELLIYPNPANSLLNISLQLAEQKDKQQIVINIFDVLGKLEITKEMIMDDSILQTILDINSLPIGVYIVQLVTNEKIFKKMLVVSR